MKLHIIDEAERCLKCKKPLCQQGCPIHTPIPQITQLLLENRLMKAGEILFANNPMSAVCSTVCNHENQCEGHCVLGRKSSPPPPTQPDCGLFNSAFSQAFIAIALSGLVNTSPTGKSKIQL